MKTATCKLSSRFAVVNSAISNRILKGYLFKSEGVKNIYDLFKLLSLMSGIGCLRFGFKCLILAIIYS